MWAERGQSFLIIAIVTFVGDSSRGILFPALWPMARLCHATTLDLGYLVATYSIGRLISSTPLGWLADKYQHRTALMVSCSIFLAGAMIWTGVLVLGGLPVLYIAQFMIGLGTGSLGVTRSYVVEQTTPEERTNKMSMLSAVQYAGFACTPLLGALLIFIGSKMISRYSFEFPASFLCVLVVICLVLLFRKFKTIEELGQLANPSNVMIINRGYPGYSKMSSVRSQSNYISIVSSSDNHSSSDSSSSADSCEELIPASAAHTDLCEVKIEENENEGACESTADENYHCNSLVVSNPTDIKIAKAVSTCGYPSNPSNATFIKSKLFLLLVAMNFTTRGSIAVYETQISALLMDTYHLNQVTLGAIITTAGILGTIQLLFFKELYTSRLTDFEIMIIGMLIIASAQFLVIDWDDDFNNPLWAVISAIYLVYGIGYPMANSAALGCFSKLQKTGKQATAQSQMAVMGSLSRIVVPIISGYLETYVGATSSFALSAILMLLSIISLFIFQDHIFHFTVDFCDDSASHHSNRVWKEPHKWNDLVYDLTFTQKLAISLATVATIIFVGVLTGFPAEIDEPHN